MAAQSLRHTLNRDGFRVDEYSSRTSNLHTVAQSARPVGRMSPQSLTILVREVQKSRALAIAGRCEPIATHFH